MGKEIHATSHYRSVSDKPRRAAAADDRSRGSILHAGADFKRVLNLRGDVLLLTWRETTRAPFDKVGRRLVNRERQGTIHNLITWSLFSRTEFARPKARGKNVLGRGLDNGLAA